MKHMRELDEISLNAVSGGDDMTNGWGQMAGAFISELKEHPEAALFGPVFGSIYLATRH